MSNQSAYDIHTACTYIPHMTDSQYIQEAAWSLTDQPELSVTTNHEVLAFMVDDYNLITSFGLILC